MTTRVEKTVTVGVPVRTAYNQWTQFESFPRFMDGVERVTQLDDDRLEWVAEIGGVRRQWTARIVEQVPDRKVAWAAVEGATNAGEVAFTPAGPDRTAVHLSLEFEPEGLLEKLGDRLHLVEDQAERDLEHFKQFIEAEGRETGAWRGSIEEGHSPDAAGTGSSAEPQGHAGTFGDPGVPSGSRDGGLTPGDDRRDVQLDPGGPTGTGLGPTTNPELEAGLERNDRFGGNAPRD